jgi:hypothetical protein
MKAKDKHRINLVEYLSNPENEMPNRQGMADYLGITRDSLYKNFTPDELYDIEQEALANRRKKYSSQISRVDAGLMKRAEDGDVAAAKLIYQRFEGWSEKQEHKLTLPEPITKIIKNYSGKRD